MQVANKKVQSVEVVEMMVDDVTDVNFSEVLYEKLAANQSGHIIRPMRSVRAWLYFPTAAGAAACSSQLPL
eukprot:COSAG01_NODE_3808_length_5677_cov_7.172643_11_plen_70_part_01